jgi:hypothetical protein
MFETGFDLLFFLKKCDFACSAKISLVATELILPPLQYEDRITKYT